ncbi:hypothetical protein OG230_20575 [Streptomyces sp. NBC_00234]|uniref:hypothetical protein n=1 Tax=Streptomyces sp. NBC_00234 TaxID=2903638 RepID=UPI002E281DE3|nr:hypothetical protein [Streptomyces sp. NBC_00234]
MTQSGQGDEQQSPAVRPAHEGVVLPAEGGTPWTVGPPAAGPAGQAAPAGGQPWGSPWGPQDGGPHPDAPAPAQLPPAGHAGQLPPAQPYAGAPGPYGNGAAQPQQGAYPSQPGEYQQQSQYQQPGPYEPQQGQYQAQPGGYPSQPQPYAQPLPPEAVPGLPPGAGGDADATQFIAPVPGGSGPGGLPPERPAESTQFLGQAAPGDADATQYIPPVPGGAPYGIRPGTPGERQPPAEFDNLFRSEAPAGATQQMPRFDPSQQARQQQHQPPQHQQHQPPHSPQGYQSGLQGLQGTQGMQEPDQDYEPRRKRPAHVPLIAAVVIGCAVIGLGAGALMSSGDDKPDDKKPVASQSSAAEQPSAEPAADPAEPQAQALDKLLADSNNSRAAVISAVEKIKSCQALDQATSDLKGAAQQRRDLVTRLKDLTIDKLPQHAELSSSLTRAWQASASADDHYAAWAVQAKNNKKICKGGHARSTNETAQATVRSGEATTAKRQASGLWNSVATKYGLTKRTPQEL